MSSRAMKNLLRDSNGPAPLKDPEDSAATTKKPRAENEEQDSDNHQEEEEEEEDLDEEYSPKRPPARNLFALLDESDQGNDVDSDDDEKEPEIATPAPTSAKKKKKNKKKKSGGTTNPFDALKDDNEDNSSTHATTTATEQGEGEEAVATTKSKPKNKKKKGKVVNKTLEEMSVEEFEKSLQQANKQLGSLSKDEGLSQKSNVTPLKQLLAVDTRFLDADAEMKRMFGARVVNSDIRDRRYAKVVKKALLAQPRNTWQIRRASGLSMDVVDSDEKEHITTFKIVHSEYYQRTQLKFLAAVASYDPNNLLAVLRESPFHVDSLLQLSEVSKHNGDVALAGEFIEQALYAFEKSFHSLFNIASGSVRLSFMEVENRSFFLAIHRHIQFLGRRGCWRTAFEFNKLLLSLDPHNDPLGALLSIDFYALKAHEYTYLKRLYERLNQEHGLDQMPNFLYSIALAQFHLEGTQQDNSNNSTSTGDKHQESSKLLQRAILLFPTAVPLLADQGNFSVDAEVAGEAAFYPATDLPKVLDLYVHMFVTRNFALWKEPEVISWLKSNLRVCVQSRFKNANDPDVKDAKALLTSLSSHQKQKSEPVLSYGPDGTLESDIHTSSSSSSAQNDPWDISLRVCRHVMVSEYTSLARYLPEKIVTATMHMHDPLPPPGSRNVYEERFEQQRRGGFGGLVGGARDAAQNMLEEVVRRLQAGGLPRLGGGGGGLQEAQLRRVTEAVRMLGAFPDQGQDAAQPQPADGNPAAAGTTGEQPEGTLEEDAEALAAQNMSLTQSLSEMMRMLGFGGRAATGAAGTGAATGAENGAETGDAPPMTEAEANEIVAALMNDMASGGYVEGEEGEDEEEEEGDFSDEDQPFGPDGDDGWEPYDPAAYE